ncbi:MAG: hypothetical protein U0797_18440 [Gemmataceae bacterium]
MEYLGLVAFAAVVLGGAYTITRLMAHGGRNDESTHGGGVGQSVHD